MHVVMLGSSGGGNETLQYASSYLVNDAIAVDAGCLGFYSTPQEQERVRHVLLTHAHADHTASLPIFLENVWTPAPECPTVYGGQETLDSLRQFLFNNEVWPDFVSLSDRMPPFVRFQTLQPEVPIEVEGLRITPVPVDHTIPTYGYVVQHGDTAVVFGGDSGPTERLWEIARQTPGLRAVILEVSFPNRMKDVATMSRHLTTGMFGAETAKVPSGVRIIAVHLKARHRTEIEEELLELGLPHLEIGKCGRRYSF